MLRQSGIGLATGGLVVGSMVAQPAKAEHSSCDVAIAETKFQIENINTEVVNIRASDMRDWESSHHPEIYPIYVSFTMNGSGVDSVMNSPAFLTKLSYDIIMACGPVSLVGFGVDGTDWVRDYGLVDEGQVVPFRCLSAGGPDIVIPWGYSICL